MRVTSAYLKKWLQQEFDRLEVKLTVKFCYKTRLRQQDYERGAANYVFKVGHPESEFNQTVYCFATKHELEYALQNGKKLYWKPVRGVYVADSEVSYR